MPQSITIQVPEELYAPLSALAQQSGQTPEEFTLQWLIATMQDFENDPVEAFIGSINSEQPDWTQNHDHHLGTTLMDANEASTNA